MFTKLIKIQEQIRIYHWQTKSYSEHKALGNLYESLSEQIDDFVEVYFGKYGRRTEGVSMDFSLDNYEQGKTLLLLDDAVQFLTNEIPVLLSEGDSDLLNIRDEMLAKINKTKYLLTLL
jgi:hypothetical protein